MKKRFLFFVLLCLGQAGTVSAEYTNTATGDYAAADEYMAGLVNGQALTAIGADKAYTGTEGAYKGFSGKNVTIAVIDGGTFERHEDLKDNLSTLGQAGFNLNSSEHGSHVAGIITAGKNNIGIHGVAYGASFLPFSIFLDGACTDNCLSQDDVWPLLSEASYDAVKIINTSWESRLGGSDTKRYAEMLSPLLQKDKLIVASAGNSMFLKPADFPAGLPSADKSFQNNIINVVAYDPTKMPYDAYFIAGYSNLAEGAQKWTLAAPGTFYSSVTYDPENAEAVKYKELSGTSMAAAVVSGAAALVQEAFPSIGGKQIADILLSTAFKKDDLNLKPYMIQENDGLKRFLFFTDQETMTFDQALSDAKSRGWIVADACSESTIDMSTSCHRVKFEDVFGQGLLNVADALKGLKYLDAERSDYDETSGRFLYTANVTDEKADWVWSYNIGQKVIEDERSEYANKNVGLKKTGKGTLTLSGDNTFLGGAVVNQGTLVLTGSLSGSVSVYDKFHVKNTGELNGNVTVDSAESGAGLLMISDGGTVTGNVNSKGALQVYAGTLNGNVTVLSGSFSMDKGTVLTGNIDNRGQISAGNGTVTGNIVNAGTFTVSGGVADAVASQKNFSLTGGTFTNNGSVVFDEKGGFSGTVNNNALIQVTGNARFQGQLNNAAAGNMTVDRGKTLTVVSGNITSSGVLTGFGTIGGDVSSTSEGGVGTSLTISGKLNSSGRILWEKSGNEPVAMRVGTLNITGGKLVLPSGSDAFQRGQKYTVINFDTLEAFDNFESQTKLSDFVVALPVLEMENKKITASIDFLSISEEKADSFSADERKVLQAVDNAYMKQNKEDFNRFYFYSADEVKKQVEILRSKVQPVQNEQLPLTKVMASQVYAHLFNNDVIKNASDVRQPYVPMQQYQGRYYRGRSGGNASDNQKVWGQFLGGIFKEDGNASLNQGNLTTRSVGAMFGYDYEFSDKFLLGLTAGAASSRLEQDGNEIDVRDYRAGIYTASRFGRMTFNTVLMGGLQKYNSERHMQLVGMDEVGKAKYDGYSAEFDVNLGYDFMRVPYRDYSFYLRSYLAASVNYIRQNAYKEEEKSFLALGVNEMHDTSVSVSPGLTLGYTFSRTVLTADIGYQRILSGGETHASAYFLADTDKTAFSSLPADTDKNFFNVGLGMKTKLTSALELNLWTGARKSKKTEALNLSATLSYSF